MLTSFRIAHPTNGHEPTDGVHGPSARFTSKIMPNCSGSIPKAVKSGRIIGVQIKISAAISTIIPGSNSTALVITVDVVRTD